MTNSDTLIPSGWKINNLEKIINIQSGKSRPKNGNKYPVYGGNGILGFADEFNIDREQIIVGRVGAYCGCIYFEKNRFWLSDNALGVLNKDNSDIKFIYYLLKKLDLNKKAIGGAQPLLTQGLINQLEVIIPENKFEQQAIATILSSLDDKIELLREKNKTLETLAQTIFKEWFVKFNFPGSTGKMIDSKLGEIPEEWRVGKYSDLVDVITGKGIKKQDLDSKGQYQVLGANGEIGKTNKYLFDEDLILTGRVGTLGTIYFSRDKVWISDNVLISKPLEKINYYYAYFQLKRINFESLNRGSTQPLITQTDLKNVEIVIPSNVIFIKWHDLSSSLFNKVFNNNSQIQTLSKIRDILLPKLMRGEIRVKEFN